MRIIVVLFAVITLADFGSEEAVAQSAKQNVEDQILATRVRLALANDTELRPFNFDISAAGTVVTLAGRVQTEDQGARAAAIVDRISGVSAVESRLRLLDGTEPEYGFQEMLYILDPSEVDSLDPMMALEMELEEETETEEIPEQNNITEELSIEPLIIYKVPDGYHMVEDGDTLLRISEQYGVSIRDLRAMNELSIAARPEVGELLRIKAPK